MPVVLIAAFLFVKPDVTNTYWLLVLAVLTVSALVSMALFALLLKPRNGAQEQATAQKERAGRSGADSG